MQLLAICFGLSALSGIALAILDRLRRIWRKPLPPPMYLLTQIFYGGLYLRLLHRHRVMGQENVPVSGGLLVIANHASQADGVLLGCSIDRPVHIMVKQEAFVNPLSNWFLRSCLSFPVDRAHPDPSTIKHALGILKRGEVLGIFPEGTRNPAGLIRPFKAGAIRFALKTRVPILPVYIGNSHQIMPTGSWLPRAVRIPVTIGRPLDTAALLAAGRTESEIQDLAYRELLRLGQITMGRPVAAPAEPPAAPPGEAHPSGATGILR